MRQSFIAELCALAEADNRIVLLTGDLGYMALEPFIEKFPDRFYNCGVAEQAMVGIATGLAEAGLIPCVYSIVNFATLRPYEFIRNGPALHKLPVRIVGVGGGVEYGHNGPTHYGLEDVGAMRLLPGLEIYCPADADQTRTIVKQTMLRPAPIYYRLGKDEKARVSGLNGQFELGRATRIATQGKVLLLSMGSVATEVQIACETLGCSHWTIANIAPPPTDDLKEAISQFELIVTVEGHRTTGGLGTIVAEHMASQPSQCRLIRLGLDGQMDGISGSQQWIQEQAGISAQKIVQTVRSLTN